MHTRPSTISFFANLVGDIKYLDLNGDGKIDAGGGTPENPGDLVILGTTNARYTYGFDLGVTGKDLIFRYSSRAP